LGYGKSQLFIMALFTFLSDVHFVGEGVLAFMSMNDTLAVRLVNSDLKNAVYVFPWPKENGAPAIRFMNLWIRCFGRAQFANVDEQTRQLHLLQTRPLAHIDAYQLSSAQLGHVFASTATSLEINCGSVNTTWLAALVGNPALTKLHLTNVTVGPSSIQQLVAAYPNLEDLTVQYVEGMNDAAVYECFKFPHLKRFLLGNVVEDGTLSIECLEQVIQRFGIESIGSGLRMFNDCVPVEMLALIGPAVTDICYFESLTDEHLRFFDGNPDMTITECSNITEYGLRAYVARNPQLKRPSIHVEHVGVMLEQAHIGDEFPAAVEPPAKKEKVTN